MEGTHLKKVSIIGASGFLGSRVASLLCRKYTVEGTYFKRKIDTWNSAKLDLYMSESVKKYMEEFDGDAVVLCSAIRGIDECERNKEYAYEVNTRAPMIISEICRKKGILLIFISTDAVFPGRAEPYKPSDKPQPINFYGRTKYLAERHVLSNGGAVIRCSLLYGKEVFEYLKGTVFIMEMLHNLLSGKKMKLLSDQYRSPTLTDSVAECCKTIIERGAAGMDTGGIYHVASPECISRYKMGETICDIANLDKNLIYGIRTENADFFKAVRAGKICLDVSETENYLKMKFRTFRDGIKHVIDDILKGP